MTDVALLRKALEYVTVNRDQHDQFYWGRRNGCGTTMCLAGHVLNITGKDLHWEQNSSEDTEATAEFTTEGTPIPDAAARALDLDPRDAVHLFWECCSLKQLWRSANRITNGEIEIPPEFQ